MNEAFNLYIVITYAAHSRTEQADEGGSLLRYYLLGWREFHLWSHDKVQCVESAFSSTNIWIICTWIEHKCATCAHPDYIMKSVRIQVARATCADSCSMCNLRTSRLHVHCETCAHPGCMGNLCPSVLHWWGGIDMTPSLTSVLATISVCIYFCCAVLPGALVGVSLGANSHDYYSNSMWIISRNYFQ